MVYTQHDVVKAEKLVETGVVMLGQELVAPQLFQKATFDNYKGARDDKINIKIPGVLPYRKYGFRNDRTNPLVTDTYEERTIQVGIQDDAYNAVRLTDEQKDFDLISWGNVLRQQVSAIATGLNYEALAYIEDADYQVTVGNCTGQIRKALNEARRVLNRFNVPGDRFLLVGSDFETEMQNDEKLTFANVAGDAQAGSALHDNTLGRISGFTVVLDNSIDPEAAYAFTRGGFIWLNAAPSVPDSIAFGATTSQDGISMRLMRDYDMMYLTDRQVVNTWTGFQTVEDILTRHESNPSDPSGAAGIVRQSTDEYFVRGIRLHLTEDSEYPAAASEVAVFTGVSETDAWAVANSGAGEGEGEGEGGE